MPDLYRKRPVVIEAYPLTEDNAAHLAIWCGGRVVSEAKPSDPTDVYLGLDIPTLEGTMRASRHDYIIKGVQGEFYPCKSDIFEATYERVADNERPDSMPEVRAGETS